uniref:Uncharacterized protein LOC111130469 isoform X4 n=1 Tax=Crassostrea virginica TaxID=6565 RepID=A0A8B8DYF6_CRAVI|nr:uncharacterized protein LOC111130469 isoform X4 [Crassostrea virginica]
MNCRFTWQHLALSTICLQFAVIYAEKVWDRWGSYGPCSRTCGGGVRSRQRSCLYQRSRSGRKQSCDNNAQQEIEYISCNTQNCEEGSLDFRAIQCQDFDNIPFLGREYNWKPYYNGEEQCSLVCLAINTTVYHQWSDKVIDGTKCHRLSDDQCVDGICQKAGCDNVLGSSARRDVCGVCRGSGESCKLIQGTFTIPQLYSGYNEIITLQKGSTSIVIKEMKFSQNFLVLKSNDETFVLNGQQRDGKPVLVDIGGTTLLYTLEGSGRDLVKKLSGQGPTKHSIQIYIMAKDEENPGVSYEFYIPRTGKEVLFIPEVSMVDGRQAELRSGGIGESSYFWSYGGWTACSTDCGTGMRKRLVLCVNRMTGQKAEPERCTMSDRPPATEQCRGDNCDQLSRDATIEWKLGDWGPCSSSCDIGDQVQRVSCVRTDPRGQSVLVAEDKCTQAVGQKPEYRRSCNENIPCPFWTPLEWSSCDVECGMGEQGREMLCVSIDNRRLTEDACDPTKRPPSTRPCMVRQCPQEPEEIGEKCRNSLYGCCEDGRTKAQGPDGEGCPQACVSSRYGCCSDNKTPSRGPDGEGCPQACVSSRYGCCEDQTTPARGSSGEGCPQACVSSRYGCCEDQTTPARGPNGQGCPANCSRTRFGCCSDGRTPARGPSGQGCVVHCSRYRYGCCSDNVTIARGPNGEGCPSDCSRSKFGCCPDRKTPAQGLNKEGCVAECFRTPYGCCPDNQTPARGPRQEGCPSRCRNSIYGCCSDGVTEARGPNKEGCVYDCERRTYGCCSDNKTSALGPNGEGCPQACELSRYGCCPNSNASAAGPNYSGCPYSCFASLYGCCPDNYTAARGPNGEGCQNSCELSRFGCCPDSNILATGPNYSGCPYSCKTSVYGCCSDNYTAAIGPNGEGCPASCLRSPYGCCPDGRTARLGINDEGCSSNCSRYRYGCCPDNITPARGPNGEGCPSFCSTSVYGCCGDGRTAARGPNGEGCQQDCARRRYGCCSDNITPARGPNGEGCPNNCALSQYGCCDDRKTIARGPNGEGCPSNCASSKYGCCDDRRTIARGPNGEGCPAKCSRYRYGCCADNVTIARGPNGEGCPTNCTMSQYGCCPDRVTFAQGFNFEGCASLCLQSRYGCCPDGRKEAKGPNNKGCFVDCSRYQFGCCSDDVTPARGPQGEGCPSNCTLSAFGCCPDQVTEAKGYDMEGCPKECERSRYGCCPDGLSEARGPNAEGCAVKCEETRFGCCPDQETPARGPDGQGCYRDCSRYEFGCCPDKITPARGSRGEGCPSNCTISQYGCCPDQVTEAKGYNNEGCYSDCISSRYGCCPDGRTEARGPSREGCNSDCARRRFGCCSDNYTIARGPNGEGCPSLCDQSRYGCCSDGSTEARGPNGEGCTPECFRYKYGCCSDNMTPARGPNGEGCPSNCTFSLYGCCSDEVTEARGYNFEGCPPECLKREYGCCSDNKTPARGPKGEGCPQACVSSRYGCCLDNKTPARGPNGEGCPQACVSSRYGCCLDNKTPARGPNGEGCPQACVSSRYGCCEDQTTPARGPNGQGCPSDCSRTRFGCCSDGRTPARGPSGQGCVVHCSRYRYGCCSDNVTIARGPNGEGCPSDCSRSKFGCCPDRQTPAQGLNKEGCVVECSRTPYGCCPDNQTPARGPRQDGCPSRCRNSIYGCCSDGVTEARGPNREGCVYDCERRTYGCCSDNKTSALGPNGEGCPRACELSRYGCCPNSNASAAGPNYAGCPYSCFASLYGCCPDNYTAARGPNREGCQNSCELSRFGCCPDSNISATGPNFSGCPYSCKTSVYGCCSDNYTAATGPNGEGCPNPCERYPYGCCQDNRTPANGPEYDGCPQGDPQSDSCGLKPERGPCTNYTVLYFYNGTSQRCERFWYGGCEGNENRFNDEEECKGKCLRRATEDRPVTTKQTCESSYYKCCPDGVSFARGPNYEGCPQKESRPVCQQPSDSGRNCAEGKLEIKWYYNSGTERCDRFWYRGCGGNSNNFNTKEECQQTCTHDNGKPVVTLAPTTRPPSPGSGPVCELDKDRGPCGNYTVQWYYDKAQGRCSRFWYGGCQGNRNRFDTESECTAACSGGPVTYPTERPPVSPPSDMIRNLNVHHATSNEIMVTWEPPQNNDVESYKVAYLGTKYYRDTVKQDPMKEIVLTPDARSYTMNQLMDGADYMINVYPQFNGRGTGPKSSIMGKTKTLLLCDDSRYGCCPDGITAASGLNFQGCSDTDPCKNTVWGCCEDGVSEATGPNFEGCDNEGRPSGDFCKEAVYGCCPDGETPAQGANYYGCPQEPDVTPTGVCQMKNDRGTCTNYVVKWFYNTTAGRCDRFWYGGCDGNDNRFDDQEACSRRCSQTGPDTGTTPVCEQPKTTGPCRAYFLRYYFNGRECEQFVYGGCQGNDNNFETQQQCESTCEIDIDNEKGQDRDTCQQPMDTGPCRGNIPRWYFDKDSKQCLEFLYGGCQGNTNNFETREECQKSCASDTVEPEKQDQDVCQLTSDSGPCKASIPRWFYDYNDGICKEFVYGGCEGNKNNYETREACESTCSRQHVCKPFVSGQIQCLAYMRRYKFDPNTGDCSQFIYGGCGGNSNNFGSLDACHRKCAPEKLLPVTTESTIEGSGEVMDEYCHLPMEVGSCRASIPAWYYDHLTGQCSEFQYGGCGGNDNRFTSREVCESSCSRENVCNMDKEEGNCLAYFERFFYNKNTGSCDQFVYGGCGGNANNFDSQESCNRKCVESLRPTCSNRDFQCSSGQCIDIRRRCDGVPDCSDGSDEDRAICVVPTLCPEGYFRCADSSCVPGRRCDGRMDCRDNSDEDQCGVQSAPTDVDVSPSRDDNYVVIIRWRAPASGGVNPVLGYRIQYTNRGQDVDESQWYTQQVEGGQDYAYVSGLQPDSTYYFKIQARNAVGYGPNSPVVIYIAPARTTDSPRGKDPNCMLPVDRGSCNNMTIMYHYDVTISDCRPFRYYGCTGNGNRFSSGQECRERCWDRYNIIPTGRPPVTRRPTYPTERPPVTQRPTYPTERPQVTTRPTTRVYTINVDLCDEASERGPCTNYSVKWYYDREQRRCDRFWYGGCEGNANRFDEEQDCQETCINRVRPTAGTTRSPDNNEIDEKTCGSRFGCCPDGITPARDFYLTNCNDETGPNTEVIQGDYTSLIKEPDTDVKIICNRYQTGYGSISWYKDGFQVTPNSKLVIQSDGSLLIRMATVDDSGMYACRIANIGSTPEIERFRLQVEARGEEVPITIFPTPAKIVVQPGMNAFLHCQAYGNPRPRVSWSRDGYDVSRDPRFTVYPNGTLIIQRTLEQDMGSYLCVANNGVSTPAQRIVMLQLRESLKARIEPVEERKREGETLYLSCSGFGYPTPSITWEKNGLPITSDQRIKIQGGSLRIINVALEDTGSYTCVVMNDEEKVEDTVSIQVTPFDLLPSNCVDSASKVKCSLIVAARLCGHTRYSRPCCESCQKEKQRILQRDSAPQG